MTENPMGGQGKGVKPSSINLNPANNDWVKAKGHGKMVETYAFLNSELKHVVLQQKPFGEAELKRN
ncbi:unnamed protein product [Pocillopora meandrina]|uniref:Uncharacterized protein n=1 Tax=Pocillopora meandrina TaxID=46732 RepID=A0AAU9XB71_9CNID|nr:unnamed protein product [Pocillopora meandrina]